MRKISSWLGWGVAVLCLALALPAQAQRHALLIGNDGYAGNSPEARMQGHWGRLNNARNDARALAAQLKSMGFEVEKVHEDLDRSAMIAVVGQFAQRAKNAEVALVYFSGHGAQIDGRNWLMPVDAKPVDSLSMVEADGVSLDWLLEKISRSAKLKIVWLDACRNTPVVNRSGSGGLAQITAAAPDTVISYAAAANRVASDGKPGDTNGWFAQGLLKGLRSPNPNLFQVVADASREVKRLSQDRQTPLTYGGNDVQLDFWFAKPTPALAQPAAASDTAKVAEIAQLKKQLAEREKVSSTPPPPAWPSSLARHPETGQALNAQDIVAHPKGLGPKMVVLPKAPPDGYLMGSPSTEAQRDGDEKQHRVTIPYVFAMSQTHVTFDDWAACVQGGGCKSNPKPYAHFGAGRMPVIRVNHNDAREYVAWLNATVGIRGKSGANWAYRYRLPSEIETEYAARAGTTTPFYTGHNITTAEANYNGNYPYGNNAKGLYREKTTEVGSFAPNAFGLYDMAGYVYAWQADCYEADYSKIGDLQGKAYQDKDDYPNQACTYRSLRGGSWFYLAQYLRSANRLSDTSTIRDYYDVGLRLTRMLPTGS